MKKEEVYGDNSRFLYSTLDPVKQKAANSRLMKTYGISIEDYDRKSFEQNHLCWICKCPPKNTRLNVDHRHVLGYKHLSPENKRKEVRGLLCFGCNTGLHGIEKFKLARFRLERIIEYFKVFKIKGDL
jgi:hypothetical protein